MLPPSSHRPRTVVNRAPKTGAPVRGSMMRWAAVIAGGVAGGSGRRQRSTSGPAAGSKAPPVAAESSRMQRSAAARTSLKPLAPDPRALPSGRGSPAGPPPGERARPRRVRRAGGEVPHRNASDGHGAAGDRRRGRRGRGPRGRGGAGVPRAIRSAPGSRGFDRARPRCRGSRPPQSGAPPGDALSRARSAAAEERRARRRATTSATSAHRSSRPCAASVSIVG